MTIGLVPLQEPVADPFLDLAVVAAQRMQTAVAKQVEATVARPYGCATPAMDQQGDDGASRYVARAASGLGLQPCINRFQLVDRCIYEVTEPVARGKGGQCVDHHAACPIATFVPAHAVGDCP